MTTDYRFNNRYSMVCTHNYTWQHLVSLLVCNRDLGQQCCYNADGNYITTNVPAGSADYYFQTDYYLQHQSSDYFPYKVCCVDNDDDGICTKYYEMRPKDNGTSCGSAQQDRGMRAYYNYCRMYIILMHLHCI